MNGMNADTGDQITGLAHLRQSIRDILTTPVGSRVMRRDYGSKLSDLVDAPMNRETLLDIYAATAEALVRWEPRLSLDQISADVPSPGRVVLRLSGLFVPTGEAVLIDGIELT